MKGTPPKPPRNGITSQRHRQAAEAIPVRRQMGMACALLAVLSPLRAQNGRLEITAADGSGAAQGAPAMQRARSVVRSLQPGGLPASESSAGTVHVTVRDASGAVCRSAAVTLVQAGGPPRQSATDEHGVARFQSVAWGEFQLSVSAHGFQEWRQSGLLQPGHSAERLEAKLAVRAPVTKLTVAEEKPAGSLMGRFGRWLTSCTRR